MHLQIQQRNQSLDALRGLAILGMVLSGSIAFGGALPAWMYHAQVPPPQHQFVPTLPGITWVDLVFPFFLFCMGAALPLAMAKHVQNNKSAIFIMGLAAKRFVVLAFFALFIQHFKAAAISNPPTTTAHVLSILGFVALSIAYGHPKNANYHKWLKAAKWLSVLLMVAALWQIPFWQGKGFDFYKSDIIIMVLANMALTGTLCYYFTAHRPLWRLAILPVVAAFFLAGNTAQESWVSTIFHFKQIGRIGIDWLYKFYFLKYLFIIVPGTFAGEWLSKQWPSASQKRNHVVEIGLSVIAILLIGVNLYCLFARQLLANAIASTLLCGAALYFACKKLPAGATQRLVAAGSYLLLLGLCLEPWEGGIKKDPSTYSYYFVTTGLAFYMLILLQHIATFAAGKKLINYLAANGKNPMLAYVAGSLLVLPLLALSGLAPFWDAMHQNAGMGLLKGLLFTAAVSAITLLFNRLGWFWKS
jgi:predicted acyltransferase